jgi:hypothetical protein
MIELMNQFNVSESFYQRLTNILQGFSIKEFVFLRLSQNWRRIVPDKKKELHITHQQEPRANEMNEHYCRRWISIRTIEAAIKRRKEHFLVLKYRVMTIVIMNI